jgi:hypothetical protein
MNLKKQLHFNSHMGRMGNQMFQYACAKCMEEVYGYTCSLDDLSKLGYFELQPGERFKNAWKQKLFFHVAKRLYGMEVHNLDFDDMTSDYTQWLSHRERPSMIWGYFQSARYFSQISVRIHEYFRVKEVYQTRFKDFLRNNNLQPGSYNAVHLRRSDYKGFVVKGLSGDDFTLPEIYYEKAMSFLNTDRPLIVVSDDPEYCREKFSTVSGVIISAEDAITDFQLLSHAADLVTSNSTFAWWAAWLNRQGGRIYCPKYFLGFKEQKEVPLNIYPESWKQIAIY